MRLIAGQAQRTLTELRRYPLEVFVTIVLYYLLFLAIFLGARAVGGAGAMEGSSVSNLAIGYIVFMMTFQSYQSFSSQVVNESQTGTLEQLAMSRYGLLTALLVSYVTQAIVAMILTGSVLVPIMATTGQWIRFPPGAVLLVTSILMLGVVGVGLALGGLALVFKRVSALASLVGFGFIALVAAPVQERPVLKLLPVGHGNTILRELMVEEASVSGVWGEVGILTAVSAGYIVLGIAIFSMADRLARNHGLLGQY